MNNLHHLTNSVESARIAAAEDQMMPEAAPEYPFDLQQVSKQFKVYLSPPCCFSEVNSHEEARDLGLRYIRTIFYLGDGDYRIHTTPWASSDQVSAELKDLILPF